MIQHSKLRYEKRIQEIKEMISVTSDPDEIKRLGFRLSTLEEYLHNLKQNG